MMTPIRSDISARGHRPRVPWRRWLSRSAGAALIALSVASCGGGGDDGGIIGTGAQLKGTVPTERAFARSEVEVRSADGQRATIAIASNGRYQTDNLPGDGPHLLRVDLGNGEAYYSVAFAQDMADATQNIHAYSDLAIRNWFATRGLDIDAAFTGAGALSPVPTASEIALIDTRIRALVSASLSAYSLGDVDLDTVSFTADDTGVDRFLDGNPVLINNGTITIVISSPDNGTQTEVTDALPIGTDLTAADTTAPSAPTGLRVLPSATDEIVVAWEASSDDIGVANYEVRRDGAVVGTTPYPVFIDSPLAPNVTYSYTVVALDASANRSPESLAGSSQTLAAPDVTAPPAPSALQLTAGLNSISLNWQQSNIADVAAFTVRRGRNRTMLEARARVTSTFAVDAGLNSGTEYCYQVAATDGSENDSAFTGVACATTGGIVVSSAPPTEPPPTTPPTGTASALASIDVSGLACTTELDTLRIDTATTISGTCLTVSRDIVVSNGGQLTIAAGTVLKFGSGTGITVQAGGSVSAVGSASAPIVLSGVERTAGYWDGVTLAFSNSNRNRFENVLIEYGGAQNGAALRTDTTSTSLARVAMSNVLLRSSSGNGFEFDLNTAIDAFTNVVSTGNARSGALGATALASIGAGNSFTGNAEDGVRVAAQTLENPVTFARTDVPLLASRLYFNASASIPAGVTLRFDAGGSLSVGPNGSLNAVGTASAPIVLTGSQAVAGHWDGVDLLFSSSTNNRLEHVVIEYAGGGAAQTNAGALTTDTTTVSPVRLALSDVTLRQSTGAGFRFDSNTILGAFERVTSTGNDLPGSLSPTVLNGVGAGNAFSGNANDELVLDDQTVNVAVSVPALDVPYSFGQLSSTNALTIAPGATLLARAGGGITLTTDGSLTAQGSAAEPIRIVGGIAQPGYWNGIRFMFTRGRQHRLEFVTVSHGGGTGTPATSGNLRMDCTSNAGVQLTIANSTLSDSAGWGIYRDTPEVCVANVGANVTFANNAQGDVSTRP